MCICEQYASASKLINVWGLSLRMPPKAPHPVIQIIDRNEQHIWLIIGFELSAACQTNRKHQESEMLQQHKNSNKKRFKKNVPRACHYTKHLDRQESSKDGKTTNLNNARLIKTSEGDEK